MPVPGSEIQTLADLHRYNAEFVPQRTAIRYQGRDHSYSQHIERAGKLASALAAAGCQYGARVAVLAKNCLEYLEVYSACELGGYIIVPVNFRLSVEEIAFVLGNTEPLVCFYSSEYREKIERIKPEVSHLIEFDGEGDNYEAFISSGTNTFPDYQSLKPL